LEEDLKQHPDNARSQFYLAQSYKDAGHLEQAYAAYTERANMQGWVEETFMAQLELGRLAVLLGKPEQVVLADLLAAYELRPTRAEPLYELARYFRLKKMYGKAYLFARAGARTPRPNDTLFVCQSVYEWQLLDELGVAAYWVEDYAECKAACETILERIERGLDISLADVRRLRDNLAFATGKLAEE
jgi:tetratricopeptide (TPR) repeat protein